MTCVRLPEVSDCREDGEGRASAQMGREEDAREFAKNGAFAKGICWV